MIRAFRFAPTDPPSSLFKREPEPRERRKDLGRNPRQRDEEHLAAIRLCPCLSCGKEPCGEAAHIRMSSAKDGKPITGIGTRPSDEFALCLCHSCHMEQHAIGEAGFFDRLGIAPVFAARQLYHYSPNVPAMKACIGVMRHFAEPKP